MMKKWLPYLCALPLFVILAYAYAPDVLKGKVVNQSDIASWHGMSHEITSYNEAHPDEEPTLWTNSMFSGMPAYTISVIYKGDVTKYLYDLLFLGQRPPSYLILSMIGGFLLLLAFGVNPWLAIAGAIGITFCSYNFQIIQVGHNSKMVALAFMPWVLAAVAYAYRRKALLGAGLFAIAFSFQIKANHPQITYYLGLMVFVFVAVMLYTAIKERKVQQFLLTSVLVLMGGLLGMASNTNHLWPNYEYAGYSMRGGSELVTEGDGQKGLKLDYATQWSYSQGETFNFLIPNFKGGTSSGKLSSDSRSYQLMQAQGYSGLGRDGVDGMPLYWGDQMFTAGPMYMGAVIVFLFVFGMFFIRGPLRWWAGIIGVIILLLGWGGHAMWFTRLFSEYVPLYNKFRTVSMALVVFQLLLPLIGFVALQQLMDGKEKDPKRALRSLYWATGLTAGFCFLMILIPSLAGSFVGPGDERVEPELLRSLAHDRKALLRGDAFRSLVFILSSAGVLWLWLRKQWKPLALAACIGALVIVDMWVVGKRYLNASHFMPKKEFAQQFQQRPVDQFILQDKDPYYRVMDLMGSAFQDAHTSYWHKTIGGYSAAKLQRYQDMMEHYIYDETAGLHNALARCESWEEAEAVIASYPVMNMLNAKYFIINGNSQALENVAAFGNAWACSDWVWVDTPKEEIAQVGKVDLRQTAIIHKEFEGALQGFSPSALASEVQISLTKYAPNALEYTYSGGNAEQLVLFSDVYYPAGWKAWIDGQPVEILRANYVLRALRVPAGAQHIRFAFEPESYSKGATYSCISSWLLLLLLLVGCVPPLVKRFKLSPKRA